MSPSFVSDDLEYRGETHTEESSQGSKAEPLRAKLANFYDICISQFGVGISRARRCQSILASVLLVLFRATPFKVGYLIVSLVAVNVIHMGLIFGVQDENLSHHAMNVDVLSEMSVRGRNLNATISKVGFAAVSAPTIQDLHSAESRSWNGTETIESKNSPSLLHFMMLHQMMVLSEVT